MGVDERRMGGEQQCTDSAWSLSEMEAHKFPGAANFRRSAIGSPTAKSTRFLRHEQKRFCPETSSGAVGVGKIMHLEDFLSGATMTVTRWAGDCLLARMQQVVDSNVNGEVPRRTFRSEGTDVINAPNSCPPVSAFCVRRPQQEAGTSPQH